MIMDTAMDMNMDNPGSGPLNGGLMWSGVALAVSALLAGAVWLLRLRADAE